MQRFYTTTIEDGYAYLNEEESKHLRVLRKQIGDTLEIVDGKGNLYHAELRSIKKDKSICIVKKTSKQERKHNFHLHIAIAPTKNIARLEWFLEKAAEIGIDEITPIFCKQSERTRIRQDRLEKILISAMKQSLHYHLPTLHEGKKIEDFLTDYQSKEEKPEAYIAHCTTGPKTNLWDNYTAGKDVLILIGPEGDFNTAEIQAAMKLDVQPVSLGESRLRTETAGIFAASTIHLLNQLNR